MSIINRVLMGSRFSTSVYDGVFLGHVFLSCSIASKFHVSKMKSLAYGIMIPIGRLNTLWLWKIGSGSS